MQKFETPKNFNKGTVRFEEKASFFKARDVFSYAEA